MNHKLYALTILEEQGKLLLDNTDLDNEVLQVAIKQLKDLEHYSHITSGLWVTDRPELFQAQIKNGLMYQSNFWKRVFSNAESHKLLEILETNFGIPNNHKG